MKSFQIYKKSGYLLVEVLVAIVIVGFFFALAVPVIEEENAKRELFISAQTLTHAIRSAQIDAKSDIYQIEDVSKPLRSSLVAFHCEARDDGRVYWYTVQGNKLGHRKGYLSDKITSTGRINLLFDKTGITPKGDAYEIILQTKDKRHAIKVTVALYTGRTRTEILN